MKYAIEIQDLTKKYGSFNAVNNLNLRIPEGKVYGFLGKNGAGKTTTIRMIMGLIKPNKGEILIFGRSAKEERLRASRSIGAIVETPGFYENLTAVQNLDVTAMLYGVDKKRISEVLELVQLSDTGNKKVGKFSLGMKQRLGIANALLHSPGILILDEPANGLDPAGIRDMRKLLRQLSEKNGITIMMSSHILSEVEQVADYIGIVDKGALVEEIDIEIQNTAVQKHLVLEVDQMEKAKQVLNDMHLNYEMDSEIFKVYCKKDLNSMINKNLISKNIAIHNSASVLENLEDRFLSITQRDSYLKEVKA